MAAEEADANPHEVLNTNRTDKIMKFPLSPVYKIYERTKHKCFQKAEIYIGHQQYFCNLPFQKIFL